MTDQSQFENAADDTLEHFMDVIDDILGDVLEVDFEGGMLTIELESGGQYIINKHNPSRQIWMSSPVSGASHFDLDTESGAWVNTRGAGKLSDMLSDELASATGRGAVRLD